MACTSAGMCYYFVSFAATADFEIDSPPRKKLTTPTLAPCSLRLTASRNTSLNPSTNRSSSANTSPKQARLSLPLSRLHHHQLTPSQTSASSPPSSASTSPITIASSATSNPSATTTPTCTSGCGGCTGTTRNSHEALSGIPSIYMRRNLDT